MKQYISTGNSRKLLGAVAAIGLAVTLGAPQLHAQTAARPVGERKPTVAVMEFDVSAMTQPADYAQMGSGIQIMLTNAIATNPSLVLVERQKIEAVLKEQNLVTAGRIDPQTAVAVGKIVGAQHVLLGQLVVQPNKEMRLLVRSVNVETSVIEWVDDTRGKGDKVFSLIDALSDKINAGLKLPGTPEPKAKKDLGLDGPNQLEAARAFSAAKRYEERGDTKMAVAMYQRSLALNGDFGMAKTSLASLERGTPR